MIPFLDEGEFSRTGGVTDKVLRDAIQNFVVW